MAVAIKLRAHPAREVFGVFPDMDSDDEEMLAALMEEEADTVADDEEHLLVLVCLAGLYPRNAKPATRWLGAMAPQEQA